MESPLCGFSLLECLEKGLGGLGLGRLGRLGQLLVLNLHNLLNLRRRLGLKLLGLLGVGLC